jgi:hypothetical protein
MTLPLIGGLTNGCCGTLPGAADFKKDRKDWTIGNYLILTAMAFDAVVSITALVLGILGAVSVIVMPAAAAYVLIGISCTITLLWIIAFVKNKCCTQSQTQQAITHFKK